MGIPRYLGGLGPGTSELPRFLGGPGPATSELPRFLQPMLRVGSIGDPLEKAADHVAEQTLVRPGAAPSSPPPSSPPTKPSLIPLPDEGIPLSASVRQAVEPVLGEDLSHVRVHSGPTSGQMTEALGARAFTHRNHIVLGERESTGDVQLLAHEATHVVQQAHAPGNASPDIQRQVPQTGSSQRTSQQPPTAAGDTTRTTRAALSQEEMERRLSSTPGGVPTQQAQPGALTQARLAQVQAEGGTDSSSRLEADRRNRSGERTAPQGDSRETVSRERGARADTEMPAPTLGPVPPTPGPATEFEALVDRDVAAYLDGNDTGERAATLSASTLQLVEAARTLGERPVAEPESSLLGTLTGISPLIEAFTRGPRGYEHEEAWLRVVAQIRDVTSALGGVVGMIGLVATISGAILSLLVPPVGAFLLTVGRFCDVAAIILDVVSLALSGFLTGYNYYRLKNATDPEEKRRLLGLVRQDAATTLLSTVAVATAFTPAAVRRLADTRLARAAGRQLGRLAHPVGAALARLPKAGALRSAHQLALRRIGRVRELTTGAFHRGAESLRGRSWVQALNRRTEAMQQRLLTRLANQPRLLRAYERNIGLSRVIQEGSIRGYHLDLGRRMREQLQGLQGRGLTVEQVGQQLQQQFGIRFGAEQFVVINHPRTGWTVRSVQRGGGVTPATRGLMQTRLRQLVAGGTTDVATLERQLAQQFNIRERRSVFFSLEQEASGNIIFPREDAAFLARMRAQELENIQRIQAANPTSTPQQLASLVNADPAIRGRWTADELTALSGVTELPKTPHHTIPAQLAPHLREDPRFIQIVNDPRSAGYRNFVTTVYGSGVPLINSQGELEAMLRSGLIPGITDARYFTGPNNREFIRQLQREGTGLWVNPHNPAQRIFFNPHFVIGHNWDWESALARKIFGEFALRQGVATRQVLGSGARQMGRTLPRWFWPPTSEAEATGMEPPPSAPAGEPVSTSFPPSLAPGPSTPVTPTTGARTSSTRGRSAVFLSSLSGRVRRAVIVPPALSMPTAAAPVPTNVSTEPPSTTPALSTQLTGLLPEPPPSLVSYSPRSLQQIRQDREQVAMAIEVVQSFVQASAAAQRDSRTAAAGAASLAEREAARQQLIDGERQDITSQNERLDQAGSAQQQMAAEGQRATGESRRGQDEGRTVQSEGNAVSVEARPEEPDTRSWLERAWDATAGALWRELVEPAIRLVRRKMQEIMEGISHFIMRMIDQALGLDEIQAQIDVGGTDIENRRTSLRETDGSLAESRVEAEQGQQTNQQTVEQARARAEEAATTQSEAEQLLALLQEHAAQLEAEEAAALDYVREFGERYAPYFQLARTEGPLGPVGAPPESTPSGPEASEAPSTAEGRITEAQLTPVVAWIAAVRQGDETASAELVEVARESESSIEPAFRAEERAITASALGTFQRDRVGRGTRLEALLLATRACLGLPMEEGATRLSTILDSVLVVAQEVESARVSALGAISQPHTQVVQMSTTAPAATGEV